MADVSPFVFDGPLPPDQLIDREQELDTLLSSAREGRFLGLWAPRRFGKTSLVGKAAQLADAVDGTPVILVDLYGTASAADLVIRLEAAYRRWAVGPFRRAVARAFRDLKLGLSLGGAGITVAFARSGKTDPLPALHGLLDLPRLIGSRHGGRVIIVFDEVQDLLRLDELSALVRSHIQHQREVASYVFAGSQPTLLAELFGDRARPLYGQVDPLRLERLPDAALADAMQQRFTATGRGLGEVVDRLLDLVDGHPQRAMLAAHCLWSATPEGETAGERHWDAALEDLHARVDQEFGGLWARFPTTHQKVLRAITRYGSPYQAEARRVLGLAPGSARDAVQALLRSGDLEQRDGKLRCIDPLLADWVDRRFP